MTPGCGCNDKRAGSQGSQSAVTSPSEPVPHSGRVGGAELTVRQGLTLAVEPPEHFGDQDPLRKSRLAGGSRVLFRRRGSGPSVREPEGGSAVGHRGPISTFSSSTALNANAIKMLAEQDSHLARRLLSGCFYWLGD